MTRDEAIGILIDAASRYGENAEEVFPRRLVHSDTDAELQELFGDDEDDELDEAKFIRDVWLAIETLKPSPKEA